MRIVNTFISDGKKIPEYTFLSLHQLRKLNPSIPIDFICSNAYPYKRFFTKNKISIIDQDSIGSKLLTEFNNASWLKKWGTPDTKHPSPEFFFHRAMERIYYIDAYITANKFNNVFHFENDVVTYYPVDVIYAEHVNTPIAVPASPTTFTLACYFIPKPIGSNLLCAKLNELLAIGEQGLISKYKLDMVNEMSLLSICFGEGLLYAYPITPIPGEYILDPSSYGQFVGGTNNEHGIGFTDMNHFLGPRLRSGKIKVEFRDGKPYANDAPIFNLHIHSKNLKDFI